MTRLMERELTFIWTVLNTQGNGKMISNMVMVLRLGLIALVMKVTMNMVRNMERAHLNGQTLQCLLESFTTIISMEEEFICGVMAENMKENGKIIKCMEKVVSHGVMAAFTSESILKTRRMGMVSSCGLMGGVTKVTG